MDELRRYFFFLFGMKRAAEEVSFKGKIYIVILTSRFLCNVHGC